MKYFYRLKGVDKPNVLHVEFHCFFFTPNCWKPTTGSYVQYLLNGWFSIPESPTSKMYFSIPKYRYTMYFVTKRSCSVLCLNLPAAGWGPARRILPRWRDTIHGRSSRTSSWFEHYTLSHWQNEVLNWKNRWQKRRVKQRYRQTGYLSISHESQIWRQNPSIYEQF